MRMKNCACAYLYKCACLCVCVRACAYVCVRVCMCVRACSFSSSASETLDRYHEASANIMVNVNNTCSFQEGKVGRKGCLCKQLAGV